MNDMVNGFVHELIGELIKKMFETKRELCKMHEFELAGVIYESMMNIRYEESSAEQKRNMKSMERFWEREDYITDGDVEDNLPF